MIAVRSFLKNAWWSFAGVAKYKAQNSFTVKFDILVHHSNILVHHSHVRLDSLDFRGVASNCCHQSLVCLGLSLVVQSGLLDKLLHEVSLGFIHSKDVIFLSLQVIVGDRQDGIALTNIDLLCNNVMKESHASRISKVFLANSILPVDEQGKRLRCMIQMVLLQPFLDVDAFHTDQKSIKPFLSNNFQPFKIMV